MYSLTYDQWNALIDEAADAHSPLFESMKRVGGGINLFKSFVDKLKQEGMIDVANDDRHFLLTIEPYDDVIGGFKISLMASESLNVFEDIRDRSIEARDITLEEIRNFEAEHGLDMVDEILTAIEEKYSVYADLEDQDIIFELVVFDSEDIDKNNLLSGDSEK